MAKRRRKNDPSVRVIAQEVGRHFTHVARILRKKGEYSEATEKAVHDFIQDWRQKKTAANAEIRVRSRKSL